MYISINTRDTKLNKAGVPILGHLCGDIDNPRDNGEEEKRIPINCISWLPAVNNDLSDKSECETKNPNKWEYSTGRSNDVL